MGFESLELLKGSANLRTQAIILNFLGLSPLVTHQGPLHGQGHLTPSHPHPIPRAQGQNLGGWLPAWKATTPWPGQLQGPALQLVT